MNRSLLLATLFLLAPLAQAADPAEKPSKDDIPTLIKQLGDDNPKLRDQASQQLRKVGKDALPALTEATKSDDPEVVSRAQSVTRQIDEDLHPKPKPTLEGGTRRFIAPGIVGGKFVGGKTVSVRTTNGVIIKETTTTEN